MNFAVYNDTYIVRIFKFIQKLLNLFERRKNFIIYIYEKEITRS